MITIDTKDSLTQADISKFGSQISNDEDITLLYNSKDIFTVKKTELIYNLFNNQELNTVNNSDIFKLYSINIELIFNGNNYLWWKKTTSRQQKFESNFMSIAINKGTKKKKELSIENIKTYSVGVATVVDNELTNIHSFTGSKEDCINFINDDMFKRYVDDSFDSKIVINLAFDENEFKQAFSDEATVEAKQAYKKNLEMWYTLRELEDIGAIKLK